MKIEVDVNATAPIYRQIVDFVESAIIESKVKSGEILPSMNELAAELGISKETVKKAYAILRDRGCIEAKQGKGFYIAYRKSGRKTKVLVLFDKLSSYKQLIFNKMQEMLGDSAEIVIRFHNQSIDLLKYYLDENLDHYDYYLVSPHFPLDEKSQKEVLKLLKRIPNRKFIMMDNWMSELQGNYGAVYQDFKNDAYDGLTKGLDKLKKFKKLNVITMSSSLYHADIQYSVMRFCQDNKIDVAFHSATIPEVVCANEVYLILNSQFETALIDIARIAKDKGLRIGKDVSIISYNEAPVNELVLGGLTTISTDFAKMGEIAARMILDGTMVKVRCPFDMIRRFTF